MKNLFAIVATLGMMLFASESLHASNKSAVAGTYLSEIFQRPDAATGLPADRSMLVTVHEDGTFVAYNSQAYSVPNGASSFNGIQLTPSLGTWEFHRNSRRIRAVFLDYFAFPINDVVGPNPNNFQVETSWNNGEYDRFAATIQFQNREDGQYQQAVMNLTLVGIGHNSNPLDPLSPPTTTYTVDGIRLHRVNVRSGFFP